MRILSQINNKKEGGYLSQEMNKRDENDEKTYKLRNHNNSWNRDVWM